MGIAEYATAVVGVAGHVGMAPGGEETVHGRRKKVSVTSCQFKGSWTARRRFRPAGRSAFL
jgi:hypothetical protein